MKNRNKTLLFASLGLSLVGVILKLTSHSIPGDVFLGMGALIWFYLIGRVVYRYL